MQCRNPYNMLKVVLFYLIDPLFMVYLCIIVREWSHRGQLLGLLWTGLDPPGPPCGRYWVQLRLQRCLHLHAARGDGRQHGRCGALSRELQVDNICVWVKIWDLVYRTLIYNGMYDIILHHTGIEAMIMDLNWSGLEKYKYYEFWFTGLLKMSIVLKECHKRSSLHREWGGGISYSSENQWNKRLCLFIPEQLLFQADNLSLLLVRNAGHMVPIK